MTTKILRTVWVISWVTAGVFLSSVVAHADMKEIKKYKEAFPEAKPKCIECHMTALPKKDDGQHENNDYGKAVVAEAQKEEVKEAETTVETYKKIGKIEEFKK